MGQIRTHGEKQRNRVSSQYTEELLITQRLSLLECVPLNKEHLMSLEDIPRSSGYHFSSKIPSKSKAILTYILSKSLEI